MLNRSGGNRSGIAGQLTNLIDKHEEIKMSKQKQPPDLTGASNKQGSDEELLAPQMWQSDGPTLGFKNLLKFLSIKRSKAYQHFPRGYHFTTASAHRSSFGRTKQWLGLKHAAINSVTNKRKHNHE